VGISLEAVTPDMLGTAERVVVGKESCTIVTDGKQTDAIEKRIKQVFDPHPLSASLPIFYIFACFLFSFFCFLPSLSPLLFLFLLFFFSKFFFPPSGFKLLQIRREVEATESGFDKEKGIERVAALGGGIARIKVSSPSFVALTSLSPSPFLLSLR